MADVAEKQLSTTDAAYAAGLFDGEGCVQVYMRLSESSPLRKKDHSLRTALSIAMTDPKPIRWIQERFGGSITTYGKDSRKRISDGKSRLTLYRVTIFSLEAERFASAIYPYVITKKAQLDVWYEARAATHPRGYRGKNQGGLSDEEVSARRNLVRRAKELKRVV